MERRYYPRDGAVWLGVNLEGMKYDDWPVARLIEREISRPLLLTRYRREVARPDKVTVLWARDAWQYSARRRIKEANLAPTRDRSGPSHRNTGTGYAPHNPVTITLRAERVFQMPWTPCEYKLFGKECRATARIYVRGNPGCRSNESTGALR